MATLTVNLEVLQYPEVQAFIRNPKYSENYRPLVNAQVENIKLVKADTFIDDHGTEVENIQVIVTYSYESFQDACQGQAAIEDLMEEAELGDIYCDIISQKIEPSRTRNLLIVKYRKIFPEDIYFVPVTAEEQLKPYTLYTEANFRMGTYFIMVHHFTKETWEKAYEKTRSMLNPCYFRFTNKRAEDDYNEYIENLPGYDENDFWDESEE